MDMYMYVCMYVCTEYVCIVIDFSSRPLVLGWRGEQDGEGERVNKKRGRAGKRGLDGTCIS
jgi:hypothetical protein